MTAKQAWFFVDQPNIRFLIFGEIVLSLNVSRTFSVINDITRDNEKLCIFSMDTMFQIQLTSVEFECMKNITLME